MALEKGWLTSGAFAELCGTTRETLRHYKDIGLLNPAHQGENGYFYYTVEQFYDFYAISVFRQTGTPLEHIRRCLQGQRTDETLTYLQEQQSRLEAEQQKLAQMQFVLSHAIRNLTLETSAGLQPETAWFDTEHLLALPAALLEQQMKPGFNEEEMLMAVLKQCRQLCECGGMQTDYQLGAIHQPGNEVSQATISHLYTRIREKSDSPYYLEKPAGTYLYLCCRGRWDLSEAYAAMNTWLRESGRAVQGNFYACDLAGFILNHVEKNAATMISVRLT